MFCKARPKFVDLRFIWHLINLLFPWLFTAGRAVLTDCWLGVDWVLCLWDCKQKQTRLGPTTTLETPNMSRLQASQPSLHPQPQAGQLLPLTDTEWSVGGPRPVSLLQRLTSHSAALCRCLQVSAVLQPPGLTGPGCSVAGSGNVGHNCAWWGASPGWVLAGARCWLRSRTLQGGVRLGRYLSTRSLHPTLPNTTLSPLLNCLQATRISISKFISPLATRLE